MMAAVGGGDNKIENSGNDNTGGNTETPDNPNDPGTSGGETDDPDNPNDPGTSGGNTENPDNPNDPGTSGGNTENPDNPNDPGTSGGETDDPDNPNDPGTSGGETDDPDNPNDPGTSGGETDAPEKPGKEEDPNEPEPDTSIFETARFAGNIPGFDWDGTIAVVEYKVNDAATYEYGFTAKSSTYIFVIQKSSGVWNGCWGGRATDSDTRLVIKTSDSEATKMIERTTGVSDTNMEVADLSINSEYKLIITIKGSDVYAQVKLEKYNEPPAAYSLEGLTLKGGWNNSWTDFTILSGDKTQRFTTKATNTASGKEWGIFPEGSSNAWEARNIKLGEKTELTYKKGDGSNSTMAEDWESNTSYTIVLELEDDNIDDPKLYVTISKTKE